MTSRERIKKTLEFKTPDRVGILDDITAGAFEKWEREGGIAKDAVVQEYFDFDARLFGFDQSFNADAKNMATPERIERPSTGESIKAHYKKAEEGERFLILSCMEPFEHIARVIGREKLLMMMAEEAGKAANLFLDSAELTLCTSQMLIDKGYKFDGAWLWGDLGHKSGLIFSTDYYNAFLFDLHKEFCDFFEKNGMPVIYHSDGNVRELIPHLIEAGVRAIQPLESNIDMDVREIKREYGKDLVLFGGIDETTFAKAKKAEKEIKSKFKYLMKGGGYVYQADSPILDDISLEDYKRVIGLVKEYGAY